MSTLREKYCILKARKTIREIIHKCVKCLRYDGKLNKLPIAPLPADRVRQAAIFKIVGTDLAGPLFVKKLGKIEIVIYTCAVFRAAHLESAFSLSTESFLQTLRSFIARCGKPHTIYSDYGTNFIETSNWFKTIDWDKVLREANVQQITVEFSPPTAP
ncbi:integrase catalytic domain-containing protein [Trichonephila inaurata madagascariensis]|uniref:Integrase catalytic domain-containing protein n=1 Tax=Trichonephila inaurata madagascariensis TaxID=2747483 RepID=A0A8X7C384_9ARAC|nr:integrase catalytic domain-containing protein [Trichonephila inaurata madagascariensis]